MTAMAPRFAYITNRNSDTHSTCHVGTVTVDTDKNRLVEIPPSSRELPDIRFWDSVSTLNATIISKEQQKAFARELCMHVQ